MLKQTFKDQLEFDIYLAEQKVRQEKGYLTKSEREVVKKMLEKDYKPTFIKEKIKLPIVTNINELKKLCQDVTKEDNVQEIVQKLKDTLASQSGLGLSANQIGIQKKISYIKVPKMTKDKKIEFTELVLINAKIIEQDRPIKVQNEECLSLQGSATTKRYVFIIVQYLNEKMELHTGIYQDLEALVVQHEIDHQNSLTIFDRKWRAK